MVDRPEPPAIRAVPLSAAGCIAEGRRLLGDQYWLFVGIVFVAIFIAGLGPMSVLVGPMMVGMNRCFFRRMGGERVAFRELWRGFDQFGESLIAALIQFGATVAFFIPTYVAIFVPIFVVLERGEDPGPILIAVVFVVGTFAIATALAVTMAFQFAFSLIADHRLSGLDAVKTSIAGVRANFWGVLRLVLLNALLGIAGALLCGVGVYLVMPIAFAAVACAHRQIYGAPPTAPSERVADDWSSGPGAA